MKLAAAPVKLIVGLGNPGPDYENTRHNAGQWLVEALAKANATPLQVETKFFGHSAKITLARRDVRLLVPTTFMNRSGQAVAAISNFFKIDPEAILVCHDELDLDPGVARLKFSGGHGGHNGLRDIISSLGNTREFGRLRIGIGHPGNAKLVSNYVLKRPALAERANIEGALTRCMPIIEHLVSGDWERAMRELHTEK